MNRTLKMMTILLFGLLVASIFSCGGGTYRDGTYYHPPTGFNTYWGGYPRGGYYHYRPMPPPRPPRPAPMPIRR